MLCCVLDGKITDLPLLPGEVVQRQYSAPGKCCHCIPCNAECCPAEFCVLTNHRVLSLKQMHGTTVISSVFIDDVTAASVGRVRPHWYLILGLCLVGVALPFLGLQIAVNASDGSDDSEVGGTTAVLLQFVGVLLILLALWIYFKRASAVNFMVQGVDSDDKNLFSLRQSSRFNAVDMVNRYFSIKFMHRQQQFDSPLEMQNAPYQMYASSNLNGSMHMPGPVATLVNLDPHGLVPSNATRT